MRLAEYSSRLINLSINTYIAQMITRAVQTLPSKRPTGSQPLFCVMLMGVGLPSATSNREIQDWEGDEERDDNPVLHFLRVTMSTEQLLITACLNHVPLVFMDQ
jgi:hypothetical protein